MERPFKECTGGLAGYGGWPWSPIPELNGDYFAPVQDQYILGYTIEALDDKGNPIETYTGINDGYTGIGGYYDVPKMNNPKHDPPTGITAVKADGIKIGRTGGRNFNVICDGGVCVAGNYSIIDLTGKTVQTGALSGASEQTITANNLPSGIYFITINGTDGSRHAWKVVVDN